MKATHKLQLADDMYGFKKGEWVDHPVGARLEPQDFSFMVKL